MFFSKKKNSLEITHFKLYICKILNTDAHVTNLDAKVVFVDYKKTNQKNMGLSGFNLYLYKAHYISHKFRILSNTFNHAVR